MNASQTPVLLFLLPFISALLLPIAARIKKGSAVYISLFALAVALAFSLFLLNSHLDGGQNTYSFANWPQPVGIAWRTDALSGVLVLVICGISFLSAAGSRQSVLVSAGKTQVTFYICSLLLTAGLLGMVLTQDLFNLFVFLEVSSLAGYALMGSGRDARSSFAGLKYLLIGSLGASLYLLGIGYLYAATGTLNMDDMAMRLAQPDIEIRSVQMGILLIFLGLAIKMGLFPFHGWQPDAYNHAPDASISLIAPVVTKVSAYALLRILFWVLVPAGLNIQMPLILLKVFGVLAVVTGSVMAFRQTEFKRMLAYSSVSHTGLIAIGFGIGRPAALSGAVLHMLYHALMTAGLFFIAATLYRAKGIRRIEDLPKIRNQMPWTYAWLILCALSMTGIPPLAGFFSKWYLLLAAFGAREHLLAAVIAGSSLLTALYFFKILELTTFFKGTSPAASERESWQTILPAGAAAVSLLVLGLYSPSLYAWLMSAAFKGVG